MQKLYNVISSRRSIRTFIKQPLSSNDLVKIEDFLKELNNLKTPFSNKISVELINQMSDDSEKIGTYGFVKNASAFFAGSIDNQLAQIIDYGFIYELLVLWLWNNQIGSVWLGGTFNRTTVSKFLDTKRLVPAVLAIGYPADQSFTEKAIRFVVKATNRKPLEELVILKDKATIDDELKLVFEAMRLGPSGSNQQPWRINLYKDYFELVLLRTPNYAKELNYEMQGLDIGIALAHLKIALEHLNIKYKIEVNKDLDTTSNQSLIATFKIKKPD